MKKKLSRLYQRFLKSHYKLFYGVSRALSFVSSKKSQQYDLVCVLSSESDGWILEKLARVIISSHPGKTLIAKSLYKLPHSNNYLFMHYKWLFKALKFNPHIWSRSHFVWYTHPNDDEPSIEEQKLIFNEHAVIISACQLHRDYLINRGINNNRINSVLGAGADPDFFKPSKRDTNIVGLCSAFYERKRPDLLLSLVEQCQQYDFLLIGKGWEQYPRFNELLSYKNFTYEDTTYDKYPALYQQMSVFLSLSTLEGGPVPLLEAMMANVVPVVSNTGFAPEIVKHGENGYVFDHDVSIDQLQHFIDEAMKITTDVRADVLHYTWDYFANQVLDSIRHTSEN